MSSVTPARGVETSELEHEAARLRVIVIDYHLMAGDLCELLARAGALVQRVYPRSLSVASFRRACSELQPHFVLGINFAPPIAALCSAFGIPYVSWSIDPLPPSRMQLLDQTDPKSCLAFAHRRQLVDRLRQMGLTDVHWLPLAAAADRRKVVSDVAKLEPYRCSLSFVGGSLETEHQALQAQLREWGIDAEREARLDEYLRATLDTHGSDPTFMGFEEDASNLEPAFLDWVPEGMTETFVDLLNGRLSNLYRIERVRSLDALGISVYGDDGWAPHVRHYRGLAQHGEELTCIYNASQINLDVPRIYQRDIVTLRVFDILATSGFLLSERSQDLLDLFGEGRFLGSYSASESLKDRVAELQTTPERCRELALAGQREVLARHLMSHRLNVLISACHERGWL
jgi:spore maturation protein CgeB